MCFSPAASFTISAVLLPTGLYALQVAVARDKRYLPMAVTPLAFGIQQAFEGVLWLGIQSDNSPAIAISSFVFIFFSHWFWLFWTPFLVWPLEPESRTRNIVLAFVIIGILTGALLYLPLLLHKYWLTVGLIYGSIEYQIKLMIENIIPLVLGRLIYSSIILVSLFMSSNQYIKVFSELILVSVIVAYLLFDYVFISLWCFFAALSSGYIVYVLSRLNLPQLENSTA